MERHRTTEVDVDACRDQEGRDGCFKLDVVLLSDGSGTLDLLLHLIRAEFAGRFVLTCERGGERSPIYRDREFHVQAGKAGKGAIGKHK